MAIHSVCVCRGGGGERELNYLRVHIHAHHETKDWLPSLGSRAQCGVRGFGSIQLCVTFLWFGLRRSGYYFLITCN